MITPVALAVLGIVLLGRQSEPSPIADGDLPVAVWCDKEVCELRPLLPLPPILDESVGAGLRSKQIELKVNSLPRYCSLDEGRGLMIIVQSAKYEGECVRVFLQWELPEETVVSLKGFTNCVQVGPHHIAGARNGEIFVLDILAPTHVWKRVECLLHTLSIRADGLLVCSNRDGICVGRLTRDEGDIALKCIEPRMELVGAVQWNDTGRWCSGSALRPVSETDRQAVPVICLEDGRLIRPPAPVRTVSPLGSDRAVVGLFDRGLFMATIGENGELAIGRAFVGSESLVDGVSASKQWVTVSHLHSSGLAGARRRYTVQCIEDKPVPIVVAQSPIWLRIPDSMRGSQSNK